MLRPVMPCARCFASALLPSFACCLGRLPRLPLGPLVVLLREWGLLRYSAAGSEPKRDQLRFALNCGCSGRSGD